MRTIVAMDGTMLSTQNRTNELPTEKLAFRIGDACLAIGISRTSLYKLVKAGELKLIRIAGRSLVPASELHRLISVVEPSAPKEKVWGTIKTARPDKTGRRS